MGILETSLRPLKKSVFVSELDSGMKQTRGGILIPDDDMKDRGIRERWACIHSLGPEIDDLVVGDWVLVEHGRWTNAIAFERADGSAMKLWRIDYPDAVLLVSKEDPRTARATLTVYNG